MAQQVPGKETLTVRINTQVAEFYAENFDTPTGGCQMALEAFYSLYREGLTRLKLSSNFTSNELKFLLDATNGMSLSPALIGQQIVSQARKAILIDGIGKKWSIQTDRFMNKIESLEMVCQAALEIWGYSFWKNKGENPEKYLDMLL